MKWLATWRNSWHLFLWLLAAVALQLLQLAQSQWLATRIKLSSRIWIYLQT